MSSIEAKDWDDAYANSAHIAGSDRYPSNWAADADEFRNTWPKHDLNREYGRGFRHKFDLFHPITASKGVLFFVHGGYWMRFGRADWSHFAAGALKSGWTVCLPEYDLAPNVRITQMSRQIANAIATVADLTSGPIRLCGHSAGGHLVTRLVCEDTALPNSVLDRLQKVVSISGLHDLQPLRRTKMNNTLSIDDVEAESESPVNRKPARNIPVTAWVGGAERPEFIRQSRLLADNWPRVRFVEDEGKHHFDVIDGLKTSGSPLLLEILA